MRVRDVMTSPVHTVRQSAPVQEAVDRLAATSVTALPVLDDDEALVGMVSEGDVLWHRVPPDPTAHLRRAAANPARPPATVVRDVMCVHPVTTTADADVADVADLMLRWDIRSLPVTDGRRVVGIVSRRDILRTALRDDDVLTKEVQHRLDEYAGKPRRWTTTVCKGIAAVHGAYRDDVERTVVAVLARSVPGVVAVDQEH
ncbi:MAG TPA: CBS domain-containing protein [Actinoplanes sp.]|nr:CBS domain-containing protein [Actinoplanes sp.]